MKKKKGELAWAVVRDADLEAVKLEKDADDQGKKVIGSLLTAITTITPVGLFYSTKNFSRTRFQLVRQKLKSRRIRKEN